MSDHTPPTGLTDETVSRLNATLDTLHTTLVTTPAATKPAPKASDEADDADAELISSLDPDVAKAVQTFVNKKLNKGVEKVKSFIVADKTTTNYNTRLVQDFPDLTDTRSELAKATIRELAQRNAEDPNYEQRPSAVYDAAAAAAARIGYSSKHKAAPPTPQDDRRLSTLTGGYMPSGGTTPPAQKSDEVTPDQIAWAQHLNVPIEAYKTFVGHQDGSSVTVYNPKK